MPASGECTMSRDSTTYAKTGENEGEQKPKQKHKEHRFVLRL